PYAGGTTTCDALWMGVPVVTLHGKTPVGRAGVSLLNQINLAELIATNTDEYIDLAVGLARDRDRLQALRSSMRERMHGSPLMNARELVRDLEAVYRTMWQRYCHGQSGSGPST